MKKTENGTTTYYLRSSVLGSQVVAEVAYLSGAWSWLRGYIQLGGQLLAVQQDGVVRWVHEDPLTKTKIMTDASGATISSLVFDPWGGAVGGPWTQNPSQQRRRFTTYERDGNDSDDAMMRRYNRWHSRFDQPDPYDGSYDKINPQSFNRYAYVENDPVNFVDPSGLDNDPPRLRPYDPNRPFDPNFEQPIRGGGDPNFPIGDGTSGGHGAVTDQPENEGGGDGGVPGSQNALAQDPLPFNSCEQFVDYLVGLASGGVKVMNDASLSSVNAVIRQLGMNMMKTARFEYDRHINNRADGFRPS